MNLFLARSLWSVYLAVVMPMLANGSSSSTTGRERLPAIVFVFVCGFLALTTQPARDFVKAPASRAGFRMAVAGPAGEEVDDAPVVPGAGPEINGWDSSVLSLAVVEEAGKDFDTDGRGDGTASSMSSSQSPQSLPPPVSATVSLPSSALFL